MNLRDSLSGMKVDKSSTHEIISFDLKEVIQEKSYINTRSGIKSRNYCRKSTWS